MRKIGGPFAQLQNWLKHLRLQSRTSRSSNPRVTSFQQCVVMEKFLNFFEYLFPHLQSEDNDLLYTDIVATKFRKEKEN